MALSKARAMVRAALCIGSRRIVGMRAGLPKCASFFRETNITLAILSLLIQIHWVNKRKNTEQVNIGFRYTLGV